MKSTPIFLIIAASLIVACAIAPGLAPVGETPQVVESAEEPSPMLELTEAPAGEPEVPEEPDAPDVPDVPGVMPRGVVDADLIVDVYDLEKAWPGTTLLTDKHTGAARLIEVNMLGEIIWEYMLPEEWGEWVVGFEAELLPNGNILFALTRSGLYEVDRQGNIVWSHEDRQVSHDADRLPNGNTLYVFGARDEISDAAVKEVDSAGNLVWFWFLKDHFDYAPYNEIDYQGWGHTNAVTRLENGSTLISIRNFDMIVEVDPEGEVLDMVEGVAFSPHDPLVLENGNILVVSQTRQVHTVIEIDRQTKEIVKEYYAVYDRPNMPVRDCNLLPNGNVLITAAREIIEVAPDGEVVWRFGLADSMPKLEDSAQLGFYKAERLSNLP